MCGGFGGQVGQWAAMMGKLKEVRMILKWASTLVDEKVELLVAEMFAMLAGQSVSMRDDLKDDHLVGETVVSKGGVTGA